MSSREEIYQKKQNELLTQCNKCRKVSTPSFERCNYDCTIGRRLHMLEVEYSDVTGWSHKHW